MITLSPITSKNYKTCIHLNVSALQKDFVCSNAESLAKAYVFYEDTTPLGIYYHNEMVGFMLVRYNKRNQNYFLWEFMIDEKFQGRGFGQLALLQLKNWLKKQNNAPQLVTTYKYGNECARHLYERVGFTFLSDCKEESEVNLILNL